MKKRNLFLTLGLSLTLGIGVAAGLGASRVEAKEVDARIWRNSVTIYFVPSTAWAADSAVFKMNVYNYNNGNNWLKTVSGELEDFTYSGRAVYRFEATNDPWISGVQFIRRNSADTSQLNYSDTFDIHDSYDGGYNSLLMSTSVSGNSWTTATEGVSWVELADITTTHTITKYAVLDGVKQGSTYGDPEEFIEGRTYAVPDNPVWNGYHFEGWYTNEACTSAYVAAPLNADLTLYAKFTTLVNDSYVYYVTGSTTDTTHYIYSYGGEGQYGNDKGTAIASIATEIHGVVNFQGTEQKIYKIPYSTTASDTHIIINKNAWGKFDNQTNNLLLVSHSAYWWSEDENYHNDDAGAALDFILALEAKRNAVVAAGDIKATSICGISAEDAATLCTAYNALTKAQREDYVDVSDVWTYKRTDSSQNDNVTIYDIMEELASKAGVALNGHSAKVSIFGGTSNSSSNAAMIILLVSVIGLVAVGSIFVIRRRKEQE